MGMMLRRHRLPISTMNNVEVEVERPLPTSIVEERVEETPVVEETVVVKDSYTKSDIQKMTSAELKALAEAVGIPNAKETSGARLKDVLIKTLVK